MGLLADYRKKRQERRRRTRRGSGRGVEVAARRAVRDPRGNQQEARPALTRTGATPRQP